MSVTKNGICYDLRESPYYYEWRGLIYYFSSAGHLKKFKSDVRKKELWLNDSFNKRFKFTFYVDVLADLQLYRQIETRGFRIITNDGMEYNSPWQVVVTIDTQRMGVIPYGTI